MSKTHALLLILLATATTTPLEAQTPPALSTIEAKTQALQKQDGFFPLYWDDRAGTLWLEIPRFDTEVLYISGLQAGLGSNDIGLDRGQLGGTRIVKFQRVGQKVLMVQPNYQYRALSDNPDERRAVEEAFAPAIIWGFTVAAESGGRVLVDATDFLLRDTHGVIQRLRPATFRVERSRSAVFMPRTKAFPRNTEMEATLTFVSEGGNEGAAGGGADRGSLPAVAADAQAVTLRLHHSLVELPDADYKPRPYDPRAGYGSTSFQNYAAPLGRPMTVRYINRHRLKKKDPSAKVSEAIQPIVYYLDRGTPEPVRSALLDGARWWNQAFEAAGYKDAFRVEMMPEGADPLDVRYNVIQWVHRSTRGWSYGASVTDPRTGEIIKGHVTLGSLRVRQDYMLAEGLLSPYKTGTETPPELSRMALARLRQLSAHEVGHTLGFGHNYYDSDRGRISVEDYPHPLVTLKADGSIDISDAYAVGIGEWDKVATTYGYQHFPPGTDETEALQKILDDAWKLDLRFMSNQDTGLNPRVDQWANGTNPAIELDRMMKVRRAALTRFGETAIQFDMPMAMMEEVLVPVFLHHRYQVDVAASAIGGLNYIYSLRGDGREPVDPVPASDQRAALAALLATLKPSELTLPKVVLDKLPPRPMGFGRSRELFPRWTGSGFDPITPAVVAADHTVTTILQPDRAARMVAQHSLDSSLPDLIEVIDAIVKATLTASASNEYEAVLARAVQRVLADRLIFLAGNAPMPHVRAVATRKLRDFSVPVVPRDLNSAAHAELIASDIKRFIERPAEPGRTPAAPQIPPGAPIGDPDLQWLDVPILQCPVPFDEGTAPTRFFPSLFGRP